MYGLEWTCNAYRFLEFFSGEANLSWCMKYLGFPGINFDYKYGGRYNDIFEPAGYACPGCHIDLFMCLQLLTEHVSVFHSPRPANCFLYFVIVQTIVHREPKVVCAGYTSLASQQCRDHGACVLRLFIHVFQSVSSILLVSIGRWNKTMGKGLKRHERASHIIVLAAGCFGTHLCAWAARECEVWRYATMAILLPKDLLWFSAAICSMFMPSGIRKLSFVFGCVQKVYQMLGQGFPAEDLHAPLWREVCQAYVLVEQ